MKPCIIISSILISFATETHAATNAAVSAGYADVLAAVAASSSGDTVTVPAGAVVWTNVLKLTNSITIIGAGESQTFITNNCPKTSPWSVNDYPPLFWFAPTNDAPLRITGFFFYLNGTNGGKALVCNPLIYDEALVLHSIRVDHCTMAYGIDRSVGLVGAVYGVIDHCTFINIQLVIQPSMGHDLEWDRFTGPYYGLGGTNTIVVESCNILYDEGGRSISLSPAPAATGQGGHYVWRYNTLTNSSTFNIDGLDVHGNNYYSGYDPPYTNTPQPGWRGSIWMECYSNVFTLSGYSMRAFNLRGGTCLVFGNKFYGSWDSCRIFLQEEEAYLSALFDPLRDPSDYPAQDQIVNSFFWGNTINGNETNHVVIDIAACTNFIQLNRDYWLRAPQAGDEIEEYVPLVYPHPLVTQQDGTPPDSGARFDNVYIGTLIIGGTP